MILQFFKWWFNYCNLFSLGIELAAIFGLGLGPHQRALVMNRFECPAGQIASGKFVWPGDAAEWLVLTAFWDMFGETGVQPTAILSEFVKSISW